MKQCVYSGQPQNEAGRKVLRALADPTQSIPNPVKEKGTDHANHVTTDITEDDPKDDPIPLTEGKLTREEEQMLNGLGITKF